MSGLRRRQRHLHQVAKMSSNCRRKWRNSFAVMSSIFLESKFYRKKANIATLLEGFVEPLPNSHFRLANGFDLYCLGNLRFFLTGTPRSVAGSIAEALFYLGRQWAKTDYGRLPLASIPSDEFLRGVWSGAEEWEAFVQRDGCIGEVWLLALSEDGSVHLPAKPTPIHWKRSCRCGRCSRNRPRRS
jgi:hypothetical protein